MFAAPAKTGLTSKFDFHDRRRIREDPIAKGPDDFADGIGQLLQSIADQLVIVAPLGIA